MKICHHLLILKLFQTRLSFFLLLSTKEDILKNGNQTVDISFPKYGRKNTMEVNDYQQLNILQNIFFCVLEGV